jgi:DNA helicase-2/ATP-dependent DNA helicase PcrA
VGSLHYLRDRDSVEAMSRMGSSKRAEIVRNELDQAYDRKRHDFQAACRLVRNLVAKAVPGHASDRDRAEWTSVVEAVVSLALTCRSLEELEARIAEQSATLRKASGNAVVLSTIHSAKGLEWNAVFVVGMEDGVLPHANNDDLEEERRVAYVGITRAKRLLGLSYANVRFGQYPRPSRFLYELAGKEHRRCIWTSPSSNGADERLPLLSENERRRVRDGMLPEQAFTRPTSDRDQLSRNKQNGLPARHGRSWSADEDGQLRTMFLAGEGIAAIARKHQRKRGAIRSRLAKLGLMPADARPQLD